MPSFQLFDNLLATPLFQGMGKDDLREIVGNTKFGFAKYEPGKLIARADSYCNELMFLLNGSVEAITTSADKSYSFTEILTAPLQLQPHRLFGFNQRFKSTYRAHTPCNFMTLGKGEVMKLYSNYDVFRINLINLLATSVQHYENCNWLPADSTLRSRILHFFVTHSVRPTGEKHIKIKMNTLAGLLNDSRLNISIELNRLQTEGLAHLSRGMITIPHLELCK